MNFFNKQPLLNYMYLVLYVFMVVFILTLSNTIMVWVVMELMTMLFVGIMFSEAKFSMISNMMYFVIQSFSSILLLFPLIMMMLDFSSVVYFYLFQCILFLKLAMFPMLTWYYVVLYYMSKMTLFLVLSFQKYAALVLNMLIFHQNYNLNMDLINYVLIWLILGLVVISLGAYSCNDLRSMLLWSSMLNTVWMYLITFSELKILLLYLTLYYLVLMGFMVLSENSVYKKITMMVPNNNNITLGSNMLSLLLLTMVGFPPFPLFYIKLLAVMYMLSVLSHFWLSVLLFMLLMLTSVVLMVMYFRQYIYLNSLYYVK